MLLTIGVDSYADIASADSYISLHYTSSDEQRVAWEALSEVDKEVYLRNAVVEMEQLKYYGRKYDVNQALSFPRLCEDVPNDIKYAQIEEALELASPSEATEIATIYSGAVKSSSIGHLSETYKDCGNNGIRAIIKSQNAQRLLAQFLGGGFIVR